jgi:Phage portal protein
MNVRAIITDPISEPFALQLRAQGLQHMEDARGTRTISPGSIAAWPLEPTGVIDLYNSSPWLAAIGGVIADAISSAEWDLAPDEYNADGTMLENPDQAEYARARAWLSRHDVGMDGVTPLDLAGFLRAAATHLDTTGNVFLEAVRDVAGRNLMQLNVLLPQYLRYESMKVNEVTPMLTLWQLDPFWDEYRFYPFGTRKTATDPREYLHQRLPNLYSSVYGLPAWIAARDSITVNNAHRTYLKAFFGNHSAPRWMIQVTMDSTWLVNGQVAPPDGDADDVFNAIKNYLDANRGAMAGRNLILKVPGGIVVTINALDQKLEDPTFGQTAHISRDEIMAVRHMSLIDVGLPEGGYRATAETQSGNFRTQLLEPFAAPILALLNRVLKADQPFGLGLKGWHFKLEFTRLDDYLKRIEGIIKATGVPILTVNEGRELIDYEGLTNAVADALHIPANMITLENTVQGANSDPSPDE